MVNFILLYFFSFYVIGTQADNMLGPGIWSVISVVDCPEPTEQEDVKAEVNKHKLNRTHDGITAKVNVATTIDDKYGDDYFIRNYIFFYYTEKRETKHKTMQGSTVAHVEICKYVDGGCKQYQVLSDNNVVSMLDKYAKEMVTDALTSASIDPPEFPINEGEYEIKDYIVDYCKLPRDAVYGKFEALAYLVFKNLKVSCIKLVLEFNKFEDENFCDPDEE